MNLEALYHSFLEEKRLLKNQTPKTIQYFKWSFVGFKKCFPILPTELNKRVLTEFVLKLRQKNLSIRSCNNYINAINSFLTWLHENEFIPDKLKIQRLKEEKKVLRTFTEEDIKKLLGWKPKTFYEWRMYALICFL